jgi:hypothetical protein
MWTFLFVLIGSVVSFVLNMDDQIESKMIVPDITFRGIRPYFGETIFIHHSIDWMIVFLNSKRMKSNDIPVSLSVYGEEELTTRDVFIV